MFLKKSNALKLVVKLYVCFLSHHPFCETANFASPKLCWDGPRLFRLKDSLLLADDHENPRWLHVVKLSRAAVWRRPFLKTPHVGKTLGHFVSCSTQVYTSSEEKRRIQRIPMSSNLIFLKWSSHMKILTTYIPDVVIKVICNVFSFFSERNWEILTFSFCDVTAMLNDPNVEEGLRMVSFGPWWVHCVGEVVMLYHDVGENELKCTCFYSPKYLCSVFALA